MTTHRSYCVQQKEKGIQLPTYLVLLGFFILLSACGGGGRNTSDEIVPPPPVVAPINIGIPSRAVIKVQSAGQSIAILEEKLISLPEASKEDTGPNRQINFVQANGQSTGRYIAPAGWALIDFAQHPSGEVSAVIATTKLVKLVRLDPSAKFINEATLIDTQLVNDPFHDKPGFFYDAEALLSTYTRDVIRIASIGENLALAVRTGKNAVIAYRYDYTKLNSYTKVWRTLVEPGVSMFGLSVTSGTYDTFGQLDNHWRVHVDADVLGNVVVAVIGHPVQTRIFEAHAAYFKQAINAKAGMLVTQLKPDGQRVSSTVIDTVEEAELHGLRLTSDGVALVGRVFSEKRADGSGWNAYIALVSHVNGNLLNYRLVDVDKGEILFDTAPLPQGRFLVAGSAGYTQNPNGASISEVAEPLLAILEEDGKIKQRITMATGPRQNQLRSLAAYGNNWLVGGLVNGPGTHSADSNPALVTADGFVREIVIAVQ